MKRGGDAPDHPSKKVRELDEAGTRDLLDEMCERWYLRQEDQDMTFEDQTMRMFQLFGLDYRSNMLDVLDGDRGNFGLKEIDDKVNREELLAIGLYHRLHELGLLPEQMSGDQEEPDEGAAEKRHTLKRVVKVLEMVFYAKRVVLCAFQAKLAVHQLHLEDGTLDLATDLDTRLGSWALRFRYIANKTTPMQNLLLFLLDGAMEKRYRKSNGWMYEPVFIDGKNTHAWKPVVEIKDFVYGMLHKETCWEQWCNATASGMKNISAAIEYLTNCKDYQLPDLRKQQGVYAFRNGVYMCRTDTFHAFDDDRRPLSDDVVACKFVDDEFVLHGDDWRDIPTPNLQGIMDYQEFSPDVCDWMYVMLGRLLYPLNQMDSWQVIPFFKGMASSGKCFRLGTPVMMNDGTVRAVEEIGVGDLVMGDDGTARRVLTLARGMDDMYTLVPKRKGYPSTTVTGQHILCLKYTNQGSIGGWKYGKRVSYFDGTKAKLKKFTKEDEVREFVASIDRDQVFEMTVEQYLALPEYLKHHLVCYRVPVDFAVTEEPLFDPWVIGAWLGDGHSAGARMTMADEEVIAEMERVVRTHGMDLTQGSGVYLYGMSHTGGARVKGGNPFTRAMQTYGMLDNKHIPHELKTGSRHTRMELLAGLLDTDGWYNPCGYYEITQKRKVLAEDIAFVARSLGFGVSVTEVTKACMYKGERREGTYHRVNIFGDGLEDIPMRVERKRASAVKRRKDSLKWGFDVVPAGREDYFGFQTDGNQRFLLGDFTVTHNSTIILKVCKAFYDAQDVGVLSNNIERKFGLSAFYDKYIFVAPEIKNDLGIEQAEFQSVVSGEDLQVNVKHKKAFSVQWAVPGALAGNEVPAWVDNGGSVQRRVLLWEFAKTVTNGDMKLGEKLMKELPQILAKCNKAYLEMAGRHSDVNVWTVLPAYFRETRDRFAQSVNSVEAFLASTEVIVGPNLFCPMEDFRCALKTFEIANNFKSKKYDADFFRGPFTKYNLTTVRGKKTYRGQSRTRDYLYGVDLNNMSVEDADLG